MRYWHGHTLSLGKDLFRVDRRVALRRRADNGRSS